MRRFRKAAALGLAALMAVGSVNFAGITTGAAGLPTTDGHDKYVNKNVFDVISSDTFGTKELESPLFDKTKGSSDITDLQVPTLAYDESSIGLVWQKPEKYDNVADYNVYINGKLAGTARENYKVNAAWASQYMDSFYDYYTAQGKSDIDMVNVDIHAYRATGLEADTEYTFKVVAIDKDGKELGTAKEIKQKTTAKAEVLNIKDFGAEESEGYVTYNDEINEKIVKNTKAIQAAIDACPEGGKVVIPENTDGKVFVSGALWLKSNMTLEVNGTLWASPNSDHFEIGFLMYPFYTDTRGWGLVNAMTADESNPITNVRVTGTGTLYGNGWKYGIKDAIKGDGYTSNKGESTQAGDPADTKTWGTPRYVGGNNKKVFDYGVQAADSARKYLANVFNEDGTRKYSDEQIAALDKNATGISDTDLKNAYATRSSLLIMRNCENVYVGDITIENPSNHSVNILDSRNIATTNVKVFSFDGNNGDGLGFGCSQNVVCWGNFTDTGDDNLGFGASVGEAARDCGIQTNSEIWMFNNFLREGHGGLAAGSHTGNGIQDVLFEDTVMNHIDMAFRFKSAPTNGGFGANITMRDCAVADTNQGWVLTTSYSDPNSASSTEYAEIGEFYNFASYNVSVYGANQNTIQVLADVDPVANPQKPWHTHHNLYFQDITFGNVGGNGGFKNMNGWETLIGCENAVFYNVYTKSYNSKSVSKNTNKAWNNLQYCKNIVFQGTTLDSLNARTEQMKALMSPVAVKNNAVTAVSAADGKSADITWNAVENDTKVFYGVDTYIGDTKVDIKDGISATTATIDRLSPGVEYTFKVYVSEEGDTQSKLKKSGNNKTYVGEAKVTTTGEKDTTPITAPEGAAAAITAGSAYYTHAQGTWSNIALTDSRVRGYKIYANGELKTTVYNYEIKSYKDAATTTVKEQIGRLTPGVENAIKIVAFTDSGVEYEMTTSVETLKNYDYKAPVWGNDAKVTAKATKDGDLEITWDAATDDTKVGGYRVYVDGTAYGSDKYFNPVNGAKTTTETTYTIKKSELPEGFDMTKAHTITVQAGDTWWKAETTMGTFDKMAGFNWTNKGLTTNEIKAYKAEPGKVDTDIEQKEDVPKTTVDTSKVADAVLTEEDKAAVADGKDISVKVKVANADETTEEAVKEKIAAVIKGSTIGKLFDITIEKTVDGVSTEVKETKNAIQFTVAIPESLVNTDATKERTYAIVRIHNGEAKEVTPITVENGTITFSTSEFSTYAIVYTDADKTPGTPGTPSTPSTPSTPDTPSADNGNNSGSTTGDANTTPSSPSTGDMAMRTIMPLVTVMGIALIGAAYVLMTRTKKED